MRVLVVVLLFSVGLSGCTQNDAEATLSAPSSGAWAIDLGTILDVQRLGSVELLDRYAYNISVERVTALDGWGRQAPGFDVLAPVGRLVAPEPGAQADLRILEAVLHLFADGRAYAESNQALRVNLREPVAALPPLYQAVAKWDALGSPTSGATKETVRILGAYDLEVVTEWSVVRGPMPYPCHGQAIGSSRHFGNAAEVEAQAADAGMTVEVSRHRVAEGEVPITITCHDGQSAAAWTWSRSSGGDSTLAHVRGQNVPDIPIEAIDLPPVPDHRAAWHEVEGPTGEIVRLPGGPDEPWVDWLHPVAEGWHISQDQASVTFLGAVDLSDGASVHVAQDGIGRGYSMLEPIDDRYARGRGDFMAADVEVPSDIASPSSVADALNKWDGLVERPNLQMSSLLGPAVPYWIHGECDDVKFVDGVVGHLDLVATGEVGCLLLDMSVAETLDLASLVPDTSLLHGAGADVRTVVTGAGVHVDLPGL